MELEARYDALFQQLLNDPANLDLMFEYARVATELGNFEAAIGTLERMLLINSNLPRVRLELGVLYFRIGSYQIARSYLDRVLLTRDLPRVVRARAEEYIAAIENRSTRHVFSGQIFSGLRYQTNANSGPGQDQVRAGGTETVLDEAFTEREDWSVVGSAYVQHDYDLETQYDESWETTLLGYASRQDVFRALDTRILDLSTGPNLAFLPESLPDTLVRPFARYLHVGLNRETLYNAYGGGVEALHAPAPRWLLEAEYGASYRNFDNSGSYPTSSARTGVYQEVLVGTRHIWSESVTLQLHGRAHYDKADEDPRTNTEGELIANATYTYIDPLFGLELPWYLTLSARGRITHYSEPDPSVDPDQDRHDREWRLSATHDFLLRNNFAISAQVQHRKVMSNLPNFRFDDTSFLVGAWYRF